jgi:hypothetical protein
MKQSTYDKLAAIADAKKFSVMVTINDRDTYDEIDSVSTLLEKYYSLHEADAFCRGIFDEQTSSKQIKELIAIVSWLGCEEENIPEEVVGVLTDYICNFAS